jgi:hypothetical protein
MGKPKIKLSNGLIWNVCEMRKLWDDIRKT